MPLNEQHITEGQRLGRLPRKSSLKALMFADFIKPKIALPPATNFWKKRTRFPIRSFGNRQYGDCTIAKQAIASMRMERLEVRRTPSIDDAEAVRVYKQMTSREYGADWNGPVEYADTGAYETDALNNWRRPEFTFKDTKGRPLTIDAYLRINASDHQALREGIYAAGAHGIAVCLNLPWAFADIHPPRAWAIPVGQPLTGNWMPGSWGGHSMWAVDYSPIGIRLVHTWELEDQWLTWESAMAFLDESHVCLDSIDHWRKKPAAKILDLTEIKAAVNKVSSYPISK